MTWQTGSHLFTAAASRQADPSINLRFLKITTEARNSGRLAATRKDDPAAAVEGEDATDLDDAIIHWEWNNAG